MRFPIEGDKTGQKSNEFTGYCLTQPSERDRECKGYSFCADPLGFSQISFTVYLGIRKLNFSSQAMDEEVRKYEIIRRAKKDC